MIIYGIKNCDTMKKTFDWFDKHKIKYDFHNYKNEGITQTKLNEWLKEVELTELVNTKGTTYRSLNDEEKSAASNKKSAIKVMIEHTSVIKRPVIETPKGVVVGYKPEIWEKIF